MFTSNFATTTARYVRVKAITPDGDAGIINHAAIWGAPVAPNGSQVAFLQLYCTAFIDRVVVN